MRKVSLLVCLVSICSVGSLASAPSAYAQDDSPAPTQPSSRLTLVWLSASATFVCASLGGYYALRVLDNYDRSRVLPAVSPELASLRRETRDLEYVADGFFVATAALGVTSLVLLVLNVQNGAPQPKTQGLRSHVVPSFTHAGAGVVWQGSWF
jgi:hypothetical protein